MRNSALMRMLRSTKDDLALLFKRCKEIEDALAHIDEMDFFVFFKKETWGPNQDSAIISSKSVDEAINKLNASSHICMNKILTRMLENGHINVGDVIAFPYAVDNGVETLLPFNVCEIVDGREAIIHCRVALENVVFGNRNNYANSNIRKYMAGLTSRFEPSLWSHFKVRDVRYFDLDKDCFGHVSDKFWLLDIDELYKWYETTDERRRLNLVNGHCASWWLRHPIIGSAYAEAFVTSSGKTYELDNCETREGCAPACLIG